GSGGTARKNVLDSGTGSRVDDRNVDNQTPRKGFLRCGPLARMAGVSPDTLRHYERKGLLSPGRSASGYREYSDQDLERVRMIRRALAVGFSLDELARMLEVRERGGVPCREVREMAAGKLAAVEAQLGELLTVREELRALLE